MNPLKLTFTANEQALTKTDNFTDFASNTVSYIEATFTLGENWTGYDSVRAVWKTDYYTISTVLDANFTCIVPTEVLRYKAKVFVNLVGSIVENDTLTDRLTTFPVLALTVKANAAVNGSETAPVTPSQFEQFVDSVRDAAGSISDYSYDSEAWAVGTRGGVDVPSTDPTYHNNSKYWAEQNAGLSDEVADLSDDVADLKNETAQIPECLQNYYDNHIAPSITNDVDTWLDDHPEATTTVQDSSLTEVKFTNSLKLKTVKDYVTPQMFGAVGDGNTNDSRAIQDAISYCFENNVNRVHFPKGTYAVQPNVFQGIIDGSFNGLMLTGEGKNASQIKLITNGEDCWLYDSTNSESFSRISFVDLGFFADDTAYGNGFLCYSTGTEKQLRFTRCRFVFGTIAQFSGTGNADLNHFIQCGFDAYKTAFILDNSQSVSTDFVATSGYCEGNLIEVISGGCVNFFGGDFDCYGNASSSVVHFPNGGGQGIANIGINFIGSRFEIHNSHKLVICESEQSSSGKIVFTNCNIGVAGSLTSDQYHVLLSGNKRIDFISCALANSLKYHAVSNFSATSGLQAVINFENCVSPRVIWKNCSVEGNSARISGNGNSTITLLSESIANDFDLNIKSRAYQQKQPNVKIYNVLKEGLGFPKSGGYTSFELPTGCYIKRIYLHREAIGGAASTSYQLHIGTTDHSKVYGETSLGTFRDEQIIDVNDVGFISSEDVQLWATGETTSIVTGGVCYIEYI